MGAFANDEDALAWLNGTLSALRHPPDLTVYVCAPLTVCLERIAKRTPHLAEHRANEVNDDDRDMFAARQRIMRRLIADASNQYMSVDNSNSRIERGAHEVIRAICERLTRSEG
jgi:thymidylate kinase